MIGDAYDLGIENGTLLTSSGRERTHLYIQDGRIAVLRATPARAAERIDASGLLVMPGMVDTHVHLMDPGATEREDYPSGTAAAAAAGVTTIVEHTHTAPVRDAAAFRERIAYLEPRASGLRVCRPCHPRPPGGGGASVAGRGHISQGLHLRRPRLSRL